MYCGRELQSKGVCNNMKYALANVWRDEAENYWHDAIWRLEIT